MNNEMFIFWFWESPATGWHACKVKKHFHSRVMCIYFDLTCWTIRPTIHFSKPLLCLTLICGDGSYWSHFHVIMPVMPDKAAFVSAVLLCVQRYRGKCYFTAPKDVEGCFHSLRAVLLHERYFSKIHKRGTLTNGQEWCGLLWCFISCLEISFWWHPFTAEDPLVSKRCNATFLQICSDEETQSCTFWMPWD